MSNPETIERVARYTVSVLRRSIRRKLEFSLIGVHDANVPVFKTTLASPICSLDDGCSTQRHVDV